MGTSTNTLVVNDIRKVYPGTVALEGVSLEIRPGEVVALLGENGAGKSTLGSIIAGANVATSGQMTWRGEPYHPTSPAEAIHSGVAMIHQELRLLPELTAAENVVIGRWPKGTGGFVDHKQILELAGEKLRQLDFKPAPDTLVRNLSVASQQLVEIAKALYVDAQLLILDEPTAALGGEETQALFQRIRELKAQGRSFIYVSHRLEEIRQIADRIVVLRDGALVAVHDTGEVDTDQLVTEMVGRDVERLFPDIPTPTGDVLLSVNAISGANDRFTDVSFDVRAGEVFGIAGIVGAGRTELVRAISGADHLKSGTVAVAGKTLKQGSVADAIRNGLVMVPEDRRHQGLITAMTISENIALPNIEQVKTGRFISAAKMTKLAQASIKDVGIKGKPQNLVAALSGGNQQKVVLGKWIRRNPRVVILDEPTRGIDVGARASIYEIIAELAKQGLAVVVVSSDLEEVLGLAHRVLVLARGQSQAILTREEVTPEAVMALATV